MLRDQELTAKRNKYRKQVENNPYPLEHGIEMKECEGCYCQMFHDSGYDFCFDCLDCANLGCGDYDPNFGNCCACYRGKNKKLKRKPLSFTQKQRLHWEKIKQQAENRIEEIKEEEDTEDMLTAKRIEDVHRWTRQEKARVLKELTEAELTLELKKRNKQKNKKITCSTPT